MNKTEVVEYAKNKEDLKSDKCYIYYLTHTYDEKSRKIWVKAPYEQEIFEVICAYIQYECAEIEESFSMDQKDVLEVLEKHYGCTGNFSIAKEDKKKAQEINLYHNWEIYCGKAEDIQNIASLRRDGMKELLAKFVESFYQAKPEWRPA